MLAMEDCSNSVSYILQERSELFRTETSQARLRAYAAASKRTVQRNKRWQREFIASIPSSQTTIGLVGKIILISADALALLRRTISLPLFDQSKQSASKEAQHEAGLPTVSQSQTADCY